MNFSCDWDNKGFKQCYDVVSRYNIFHCDEFLGSVNCVTYCNHSLKQSSFLDHMFVSDSIRGRPRGFLQTSDGGSKRIRLASADSFIRAIWPNRERRRVFTIEESGGQRWTTIFIRFENLTIPSSAHSHHNEKFWTLIVPKQWKPLQC